MNCEGRSNMHLSHNLAIASSSGPILSHCIVLETIYTVRMAIVYALLRTHLRQLPKFPRLHGIAVSRSIYQNALFYFVHL